MDIDPDDFTVVFDDVDSICPQFQQYTTSKTLVTKADRINYFQERFHGRKLISNEVSK